MDLYCTKKNFKYFLECFIRKIIEKFGEVFIFSWNIEFYWIIIVLSICFKNIKQLYCLKFKIDDKLQINLSL